MSADQTGHYTITVKVVRVTKETNGGPNRGMQRDIEEITSFSANRPTLASVAKLVRAHLELLGEES